MNGYYLTENNSCESCINDCLFCSQKNSCDKCSDGYLVSNTGVCVKNCVDNCSFCENVNIFKLN